MNCPYKESADKTIDFPLAVKNLTGIIPLELFGIRLMCVLKDKITDQEVDTICALYYTTIQDWWGEGD